MSRSGADRDEAKNAPGKGAPQRRGLSSHSLWPIVLVLCLAFPIAAGLLTASAAISPSAAAAVESCGSTPAHVHYAIVPNPTPAAKPPELSMVSGVVLSNLVGCDGRTAKLVLKGNPAGKSSTTTTEVRTTTSTVTPCTPTKKVTPGTVTAQSITLALCPTPPGGNSSYLSVHDLTHLTLTIGGTTIPVTPTTSPSSNNGGSATAGSNGHNVPLATAASTGSGLAFTGADIAAMTIGGLLIVLLGLFLLLVSHRRRSQTTGDATP